MRLHVHDHSLTMRRRVAMIAGSNTVETVINQGQHPVYPALDTGVFSLSSADVGGLMERLAHEEISYLCRVHTHS